MGDDAEYESERLEEERKMDAMQPNPRGVQRLIDEIVDRRIPKGRPARLSERKVERP